MVELSEIYDNSVNFLDDDEILMYLCNGGEIKGFNDGKGSINENDRKTFLEKAYMQYVDSLNKFNNYNKSNVRTLSRAEWINKTGSATHIFSSRIHVGTDYDVKKVKHRVYINSSLGDKWKIADLFRERCEERKIPYYFKLFDQDQEDNMVIYSHTECLADYIDILQEIEKEYPEMMERCGKPPLLTRNKLNDWIGIADEPTRERFGNQSYNEVMKDTVQRKLIQLSDESIIENYNKDKQIDIDGQSVRLQDALSEELYNYVISEMKKSEFSTKFDSHWTGIKPEDLENGDIKNNIRRQIEEIFNTRSIEELINDKIVIDTKPSKARGVVFRNVFDTNRRIKELIKENCCDFDKIRGEIKDFLSQNGIDPNKPCFMEETRSLFGVKDEKEQEQQTTSSPSKKGPIQVYDEKGNIVIQEYINPTLLERRITLPNGNQINATQYIQEVVVPHIPESGTFKLKNGVEISARQYIEEFVMFELEKYNGDLDALMRETLAGTDEPPKRDVGNQQAHGKVMEVPVEQETERDTNTNTEDKSNLSSFRKSLEKIRDREKIGLNEVKGEQDKVALRQERGKLVSLSFRGQLDEDGQRRLQELNNILNINNYMQQHRDRGTRKGQYTGQSR